MVTLIMNNFGARLVFPCFDQRGFKSKFKIRLGHPPGWTAVSNGKRLRSKSIDR